MNLSLLRKFLIHFVMLFLLGFFSVASAQNFKKTISIKLEKEPLALVIDTLGKTAHVMFSYNPDAIHADRKVSLVVSNRPLNQILDELLGPLKIEWKSVSGSVVLKPVERPDSSPNRIAYRVVSGYVRDSLSGEVLIGASVFTDGTITGTVTNGYGFYSLTIPDGVSRLLFSYVGYRSQAVPVDFSAASKISVFLGPRQFEMVTVEVTDQSRGAAIESGLPSQMKLTPMMLTLLPAFAGQKDLVKSLSSLPGITGFGDGSALFYVRGGASDQNLLMIDEAPIYNPAHLFGFYTAMAPDAISDLEAFKGDFPAQYGGRISSVIHVRTKDGNLYKTGVSGNLSPYTSNITVEGPILENRSSYFIAARVSNLNWIKPTSGAFKNFDFHFFDVNAKFNMRLSDNNRLFLTLFTGEDVFTRDGSSSLKTYGINWKNQLGSLRWNHVFGQKLFSNTTFYLSRYNYKLYLSKELGDYWNSSIDNAMLKTDFTWYAGGVNTVKAGAEFGVFFMNPGNVQLSSDDGGSYTPVIPKYRSRNLAVYLSDELTISTKWSANIGLRLSSWYDVGPTTVYTYDALHQLINTDDVAANEVYDWFVEPEPRLLLRYKAGQNLQVQWSYGHMVQFLQVLSNSTSPFTSLEVWAPAGPNILPQKSDQVAAGLSALSRNGMYGYSAGLYYRWLSNQIDYRASANLLYNEHLESELQQGKGKAYGAELMLRKTKGRFTGWFGYTWSRSLRSTPEVNGGNEYPASYDRPHCVAVCMAYALANGISVSAAWYYMTGSAYSAPAGFLSYNGYVVPVYGDKNNARLPDYHRLDVSANFRLSKLGAKFQHIVVVSVYNAYGRMNPFAMNNNKIMADNGDFVVPSDLSGGYEIIPSSLSVSGVIPSVNYQFKF